MKKRHEQKLVILSIALFMMFNAPFVLIFSKSWHFMGFPAFYVFTFGIWALSVVISFIIMKRYYD